MGLSLYEWLNGILLLIFLLVTIIVGLKIALAYTKSRDKNYLFIGFAWIGVVTPWFPGAISFLLYITTGNIISYELAIIFGLLILAPTSILWVYAFTDLLGLKKSRSLVLIVVIIYNSIMEAILLYYLFNSPHDVVHIGGPVDVNLGGIFVTPYIISQILILEITGIFFSRKSIIYESPEIKLKGKFLLIAFITFAIGGILDIFSINSILILTIARITLISCSLMLYCGFILPDFVKKFYLNED